MWPLKILRVVAATRALSFQYDTLVTILWRAHTHRHILKWAEHMRQMNRCRVSFRTESRIRLKPLKERAQSVHFYTPSDKYQLAYIFLLNMYGFVVAMFISNPRLTDIILIQNNPEKIVFIFVQLESVFFCMHINW